jgi:outer membrane autotransporter protein
VQGDLTFDQGSNYVVAVNPTDASHTVVSGTTTLGGGTVRPTYLGSGYIEKQYTLIQSGSVSGQFANLSSIGLPGGFTESLSYDASHVYLNLTLDFNPDPGPGPRPAPTELNINQQNVADALVNHFNTAGNIPVIFGNLTPLDLTHLSGEVSTATQRTTMDAMNQFMGGMSDTQGTGRDFALCEEHSPLREKEAQLRSLNCSAESWSVWASGYGGSRTTKGNDGVGPAYWGSHDMTDHVYGVMGGFDYRRSQYTTFGFAVGGGGTDFRLIEGLGSGTSNLMQAGLFLRQNLGSFYTVTNLAYGWQDVSADRTVTVNGTTNRLQSKFNSNTFSARFEGGYRFHSDSGAIGLTPYLAGQFMQLDLPAYQERAVGTDNTFALQYAARNVSMGRADAGLKLDGITEVNSGILTLGAKAAYGYNFQPHPTAVGSFQNLSDSTFEVNGASIGRGVFLGSVSAQMQWRNGFSLGASAEGELSSLTRAYGGRLTLRYQW